MFRRRDSLLVVGVSSSCLMLIYVGSKGFFVLGRKYVEVGLGLKKFNHSLFYVGEGEKFFYTHLCGVLWSNLEVAAIF